LCERRHSPKKFSLRLVIGGVCQQGDFAQPWPLVRWPRWRVTHRGPASAG
jgi:hypothetical protein